MKISKSKQELARIISDNGGWRDGAEWAAQDKSYCSRKNNVVLYKSKPPKPQVGDSCWGGLPGEMLVELEAGELVRNWHQTILSRAEYFHLYPVLDADGWIEWNGGECPVGKDDRIDVKFIDGDTCLNADSDWDWSHNIECKVIAYRLYKPEQSKPEFCESVMQSIQEPEINSKNINITQVDDIGVVESKPTIEQLSSDYQAKLDIATRAQEEADAHRCGAEVALSKLEIAVKELGFRIELVATKQEHELVVTDWRDLRVGDVVEGRHYERMIVGEVCEIDEECHDNRPFRIHEDGGNPWWVTSKEFTFIRRP